MPMGKGSINKYSKLNENVINSNQGKWFLQK
jgi:hypothetical protein